MLNWKVIKSVSYWYSKYYGRILSPIDAGLDVIIRIYVCCKFSEPLRQRVVSVLAFLQFLLIIVFGLVLNA